MIKASTISTETVTGEQIGKCHKVYEGSTPVWLVESESDETVEYRVKHSTEHGFTCTCKAGQEAFSKCRAGYCKHVLWALAASREEREAVNELHRLIAEQAVQAPVQVVTNVDAATLARVEVASQVPAKVSKAKAYEAKAFSILK